MNNGSQIAVVVWALLLIAVGSGVWSLVKARSFRLSGMVAYWLGIVLFLTYLIDLLFRAWQ